MVTLYIMEGLINVTPGEREYHLSCDKLTLGLEIYLPPWFQQPRSRKLALFDA